MYIYIHICINIITIMYHQAQPGQVMAGPQPQPVHGLDGPGRESGRGGPRGPNTTESKGVRHTSSSRRALYATPPNNMRGSPPNLHKHEENWPPLCPPRGQLRRAPPHGKKRSAPITAHPIPPPHTRQTERVEPDSIRRAPPHGKKRSAPCKTIAHAEPMQVSDTGKGISRVPGPCAANLQQVLHLQWVLHGALRFLP
jgi:hypothetical protein